MKGMFQEKVETVRRLMMRDHDEEVWKFSTGRQMGYDQSGYQAVEVGSSEGD